MNPINLENFCKENSFKNFTPCIHFLDGLLNSNFTIDRNIMYNFLSEHNNSLVTKEIGENEIYYLNFIYDKFTEQFILNFYDFKNRKKPIIFKIDDTDIDEKLTSIIPYFKYCICQIGANLHATSLLIYHENDKLIILSFNSGQGIEKHKKKVHKNITYFLPYFGIQLNNNLNNVKKILSFLLLSELYNYDENSKIQIIDKKTYFINTQLTRLIKIIYLLNPIDFDNIGFRVKINETKDKSITYNTINLNPEDKIIVSETKFTDTKESLYDIIFNLFKSYEPYNLIFCDPYTKPISFDKMHNYIKNNTILHYFEEEYYIRDQKSGSCVWFSIYWPLIHYFLFVFLFLHNF